MQQVVGVAVFSLQMWDGYSAGCLMLKSVVITASQNFAAKLSIEMTS
jgi:hypothetical protein